MSAVSLVSSTRPSCHYMAILSTKGKWLHFKNLSVSSASWPCGGKDIISIVYIIAFKVLLHPPKLQLRALAE